MLNATLKQEIRNDLEIILASPVFSRSPLLSKFLRFVVEATIEDHENQIKEFTVGINVLNKPQNFNPQTDASVRINAVRLRKMLTEYYQQENDDVKIRIELPKGSYVPTFSYLSKTDENIIGEPEPEDPGLGDVVCILPFSGFMQHPKNDFSISGFCDFLSEKLSLFQDIKVVSFHSAMRFMQEN